jgi:hypothetical protein
MSRETRSDFNGIPMDKSDFEDIPLEKREDLAVRSWYKIVVCKIS